MKMKLTAAAIGRLKLPPGKNDDLVFDSAIHGFAVRLREGGHRSYVFQYKLGSRTAPPYHRLGDGRRLRHGVQDRQGPVRPGAARRRPGGREGTGQAQGRRDVRGDRRRPIPSAPAARARPQSYTQSRAPPAPVRKAAPPLRLETDQQKRHRRLHRLGRDEQRPRHRQPNARLRCRPSSPGRWAKASSRPIPSSAPTASRSNPRERVLDLAELRLIWNALSRRRLPARS